MIPRRSPYLLSLLLLGAPAGGGAQSVIAAPGECAEPTTSVVTQPVRALPTAVAGSASDHFRPDDERGDDGLTLTDLLGLSQSSSTTGQGTSTSTRLADGTVVWSVVRSAEGGVGETPDAGGVVEPVAEGVVEPIADPVVEGIVEPIAEPVLEPIAEPLVDPIAEPLVEPILEPLLEPIVEPLVEPLAEPIVEPVAGEPLGGLP